MIIMNHSHYSSKVRRTRTRQVQVIISSSVLDSLMSSSNSEDCGKSSVKDGFDSLPVSPTRDKKHLVSDDKTSALRFTPSQIHKVHKKKKDGNYRLIKRKSNYVPSLEETCRSKNRDGEIPSENSISTSGKDQRSSETTRKSSLSNVTQESCISNHESEQDSNNGLETYRSKEEYNQSSARSNFSNHRRSISPIKSNWSDSKLISSRQKSEHDLDSNDEIQNSSIYFTPQGTLVSTKSKEAEERQNSRFKRSLSDEYNDESHSANSSFNNSGYYTPESSPSKFNSAKRLKTRWSDSSVLNQNNSSYLSWRHNTSYSSDQGIQPELIGYQMVGDSQFCRFGQQLLGLERVPMPNSPGRIGICVSGQTITDLHRRVRENFYPISDKVILMIGTNDFLRNVDVSTMCEELSGLIQTLKKSASNIILLTLPPIPKLEKKSSMTHFKLLDVYNSHIRSLENGETLRIADVSPLYMTSAPYQRCRMHLFEVFFGGAAKRLDLIHLNRLGLEIIRKYILEKFLL